MSDLTRRVLVAALVVLAVVAVAFFWRGQSADSVERLNIQVKAPVDARTLSFNRLWGQLAQATAVNPDGASVENLRLHYLPSGAIRSLELQVLTQDRWLLQLICVEGTRNMAVSGSRIPDGELLPQKSSWSVPLDPLFSSIDRLGLDALESELETSAAVESLMLEVGYRDADGGSHVPPNEPAFYYENGGLVHLVPDDPRRECSSSEVVLMMGMEESVPGGVSIQDFTYFVVPGRG